MMARSWPLGMRERDPVADNRAAADAARLDQVDGGLGPHRAGLGGDERELAVDARHAAGEEARPRRATRTAPARARSSRGRRAWGRRCGIRQARPQDSASSEAGGVVGVRALGVHYWCIRLVYPLCRGESSMAVYKVNVSLPPELVAEIDAVAAERGTVAQRLHRRGERALRRRTRGALRRGAAPARHRPGAWPSMRERGKKIPKDFDYVAAIREVARARRMGLTRMSGSWHRHLSRVQVVRRVRRDGLDEAWELLDDASRRRDSR